MRHWISVIMLALVVAARADDSLSVSLHRLSTVGTFALGPVGYGAVTSQGEIDFAVVMMQPTNIAIDAFEKLYATGNPQAKSYALAGLHSIDAKRFEALQRLVESSQDKVVMMSGCEMSTRLLRDVAKEISGGQYSSWERADLKGSRERKARPLGGSFTPNPQHP